jgi:hypothetical protein
MKEAMKVLYQGSLEDQRRGFTEWDKVVKEIEDKNMTIKDVVVYVKDSRGVNYSYECMAYTYLGRGRR